MQRVVLCARAAKTAALRLMGLSGTLNELRSQCTVYFILILLSAFRTQLTITSSDMSAIPKGALPDPLRTLIRIKVIDIVVVAIYVLVPLLCGRSIAAQYGFLKLTSLRNLFFNAFFTDEVNLQKFAPVVTILLTSASAGYLLRLAYFVYNEWTSSLNPLIQTLQFYPSILTTFQTCYQGIFLLQAFGNQKFLHTIVHLDREACLKQFQHHVLLNFTLLLHCCSILAIVAFRFIDQNNLFFKEHDLIFDLALGEIMYRFFAIGAFCCLMAKVKCIEDDKSFMQSTSSTYDPQSVAITIDLSLDNQESFPGNVAEESSTWTPETSDLATPSAHHADPRSIAIRINTSLNSPEDFEFSLGEIAEESLSWTPETSKLV